MSKIHRPMSHFLIRTVEQGEWLFLPESAKPGPPKLREAPAQNSLKEPWMVGGGLRKLT